MSMSLWELPEARCLPPQVRRELEADVAALLRGMLERLEACLAEMPMPEENEEGDDG